MRKDDTTLIEDVIEELKADPAIDSSRVEFAAHDGVVTLNGTVPTYWQKVEAERSVWRILGVKALANELHVDIPGTHMRDDTDIAGNAIMILRSHSDLPDAIKVTVKDGFITLTGKVDWHFPRTIASSAVRHLHGVKGVLNNIELNSAPRASDVRNRIKLELMRTLDQEVNRIDIETSDCGVTLSGKVQSSAEAASARRAAWAVPGVRNVKDLLTIA